MAYSTSNPPICILRGGQYGGALWLYDTTDTAATVDTAAYISNAFTLGMKKGDLVIRTTWSALPTAESDLKTAVGTAPTISTTGFHKVMGIDPTTGSANLADALAITVTDTD